jgi:hypothetical protein
MDYYEDCPGCGRYDHGFNMSDVRSNLTIDCCKCQPKCSCTTEDRGDDYSDDECVCRENGCDCDHHKVKVTVQRVFDKDCDYCGGVDYRCVFNVTLDGARIKRCESEREADAFVAKVFPTAKPPERDLAWESERPLRIAEGWGC